MKKLKMALGITAGVLLFLIVLSLIGGNMTTLKHEIKINASKERVFSTLANLELVQKYNPGVISAKYISTQHKGIGAARECDLGKEGKIRERVTDFKEGQLISMELYEHN